MPQQQEERRTRTAKPQISGQAETEMPRPDAPNSPNTPSSLDSHDPQLPEIDWAAALDENQSWLRTVIAARVGEAEGVEEVFQEVSLAAVRQKAPIHDPAKVAPWLYRLAVIHSLLYRRTMGRKRKLIHRYQEKIPIVEHDARQLDPLDWLLAEERKTMVRQAMATLPKKLQELLLLKYIHDWSYREMAEKLGISVSAVQARLHRARGILRERLASQLSDEEGAQ